MSAPLFQAGRSPPPAGGDLSRLSLRTLRLCGKAFLSSLSDFPPPFLCVLCVKSFALSARTGSRGVCVAIRGSAIANHRPLNFLVESRFHIMAPGACMTFLSRIMVPAFGAACCLAVAAQSSSPAGSEKARLEWKEEVEFRPHATLGTNSASGPGRCGIPIEI